MFLQTYIPHQKIPVLVKQYGLKICFLNPNIAELYILPNQQISVSRKQYHQNIKIILSDSNIAELCKQYTSPKISQVNKFMFDKKFDIDRN